MATLDELNTVADSLRNAAQALGRAVRADDAYLYDIDNNIGHASDLVVAAMDHVQLAINQVGQS